MGRTNLGGVGRVVPQEGHRLSPEDGRPRQVWQAISQCGTPTQRTRYTDNESNYCLSCQTGDALHADQSLCRFLKGDWPRSVHELDEVRQP